MHLRYCLGAILVLAGTTVSAVGQTKLEWKLKEGDQFFLQTINALRQTIQSTATTITEETTTVQRFRVVKQDARQLVLEKTLRSRRVKNTFLGPGNQADAQKKLDERSAQIAKKLEGAVCTILVEPSTGKIVEVRGVDEHIAKAFGDKPELEKTVAAEVSAKTVKQEMETIFTSLLPGRPVQRGDAWEKRTVISFGPIGEFAADGNYAYEGKSDWDGKSADRVDVAWTLTYAPPGKDSGLPYTIKRAALKTEKAKGTYYFDADKGRLVHFGRTVQVKGMLEILLGSDQAQIEIEEEQRTTIRLLDRDPESK